MISILKKSVVGVCMVWVFCMQAAASQAQPYWSLHVGSANSQSRVGLQWESAPMWSSTLMKQPLELNAEIGVARWQHNQTVGPGQNKSLFQLSATPMLR